jgi:hypothetical protein
LNEVSVSEVNPGGGSKGPPFNHSQNVDLGADTDENLEAENEADPSLAGQLPPVR